MMKLGLSLNTLFICHVKLNKLKNKQGIKIHVSCGRVCKSYKNTPSPVYSESESMKVLSLNIKRNSFAKSPSSKNVNNFKISMDTVKAMSFL